MLKVQGTNPLRQIKYLIEVSIFPQSSSPRGGVKKKKCYFDMKCLSLVILLLSQLTHSLYFGGRTQGR